jgi:hypothetical protein
MSEGGKWETGRGGPVAHHVTLPLLLVTVALLGGLRIAQPDQGLLFLAPPLVTLLLASLLMLLLWRGGLVGPHLAPVGSGDGWADVSHSLTLVALFAASAQVFNSVLPERGLLHWMLSLFLLWTLWTSLFLPFDPARLLRSLAANLGFAFVLKHLLLAALEAPEAGWGRKLLSTLLEGAMGAVETPVFAPATGYVSFFTVALYVVALLLASPAPRPPDRLGGMLSELDPDEREALRRRLLSVEAGRD